MLRQSRQTLYCATSGPAFHDLTQQIDDWLRSVKAADGCVTLFIRHTSASLTIQENADPDVLRDLTESLGAMAPRDHSYHHSTEGPDDMPAHVKTMLTSVSLTIPVTAGRMDLGTWQAVYLIEHRDHPHRREITAHYVGE